MFRGTERKRLYGHRRMIAAARDEIAAVYHEQVRHIVSFVIFVHYRCLRIVSHPAGAAIVCTAAAVPARRRPDLLRTSGLQNFNGLLPEELHVLDIVGWLVEVIRIAGRPHSSFT